MNAKMSPKKLIALWQQKQDAEKYIEEVGRQYCRALKLRSPGALQDWYLVKAGTIEAVFDAAIVTIPESFGGRSPFAYYKHSAEEARQAYLKQKDADDLRRRELQERWKERHDRAEYRRLKKKYGAK